MKSQVLHTAWRNIWWGCRGNLKLNALGSERVKGSWTLGKMQFYNFGRQYGVTAIPGFPWLGDCAILLVGIGIAVKVFVLTFRGNLTRVGTGARRETSRPGHYSGSRGEAQFCAFHWNSFSRQGQWHVGIPRSRLTDSHHCPFQVLETWKRDKVKQLSLTIPANNEQAT